MSPVEQLRAVLSRLPDVEQSASRFGSRRNAAWSVAGRSDAKAHFRKGVSDWLAFEFHTQDDVAHLALLSREAWAAAKVSK